MTTAPPLSPDGCYYWDGTAWRSLLSADGRSKWNGTAWVPFEPTPAPAGPADDRPSWLPAEERHEAPRARAAEAPKAAEEAPTPAPAVIMPHERPRPPAPSVSLRGLVGAETIAPIALVGFVGVMGLGWWFSQPRAQEAAPDVLYASHAQIGYKTGEVLRFAVSQDQHGVIKFPDGTQQDAFDSVNAVEDFRVISVGNDGSYTIGIKFEKLSGQVDGQDVTVDVSHGKEAVLVLKPDGQIVSGGTNGSVGGGATNTVPASDQFFSILPDHTVKAGDTWGEEWTRPNPLGTGSTTYHTTNTFVHYDNLAQFGQSAVVRTQVTSPIDVALNIRQLLELTGDDTTGIPAGAMIVDKGNADDDITTYVDMNSRLPVHMLDVSNFDFDETFQGLPTTGEFAVLKGTFHWAGHQSGSMDLLELPKTV